MSDVSLLRVAAQYYNWRADTQNNEPDRKVAEWLVKCANDVASQGAYWRLSACDEPASIECALAVAAAVLARNPFRHDKPNGGA